MSTKNYLKIKLLKIFVDDDKSLQAGCLRYSIIRNYFPNHPVTQLPNSPVQTLV